MIELTPFLKSLISAPGLTGHETPVHDLIADTWRPLVDELTTSRIGSLHGLRKRYAVLNPARASCWLVIWMRLA
jgi:putative aminopeptidase FrvX